MPKLSDLLDQPDGLTRNPEVFSEGLSRLQKSSQIAAAHRGLVAAILGFALIGAAGFVNLYLIQELDLRSFYFLGCIAVGWFAGLPATLICALISTAFVASNQKGSWDSTPWISSSNSILHLLGSASFGWLAARLGNEARNLRRNLGQGTASLQKEVAEHEETSDLLREAIQLFRQVTDNIADVFWVTNPTKTKVEYVSPGFELVFGRACQTLLASPNAWLDAIHHEDRERVTRATFSKQIRGDYDEEYRLVRPDGSLRWVHDRAFPVKDANGAVYRLVGITEDITERKRAEQLMQAERDIGAALGSTSDLKFALDRLLEIALQLEGIDCGGVYLMDHTTGDLHLEAHRGLSGSFVKRISHHESDAMESRLARKGEATYLRCELIPRSLEVLWGSEGLRALAIVPVQHKGTVQGMLNLGSYSHDEILPRTRAGIEMIAAQVAGAIARIRAEEEQRRSQEHLRTIINSAPVALLAVDAEGIITFQDGKALFRMAVQSGEQVHRRAVEVFSDFPLMLRNIQRALAGEEFDCLLEFDSTVFECRFTPLLGLRDEPAGFTAVATDITERSRLQRQILEISDREQARFGQDLHDGLCQLLIGMAFRLNSLEQSLSAQQHPEVDSARKICTLLNEAIDESRRVSRGLYPIRLSTQGLLPALEELALDASQRYAVRCVFEVAGEPAPLDIATATHLYRIVQEAVNNALKHSGARNISIHLTQSECELLLEVRDDGKGIEDSSLQGSGMGLHIMNYRARLIRGSLTVQAGKPGTIVHCRLP